MIILQSGVGNYITLNNKKYSYFAGNNYLGLANHPSLKKEAISAIEKYGINFSASRETTGTSEIHLQLEQLLAQFKNKQSAIVFASGYLGNKILLHVLRDRYTAVFADESAHPSILDGTPPDISQVIYYDHCNADHLEELLKKNRSHNPLIISDGIFALTGEIAPVDQIYFVAKKFNALLIIDDAHASGVLGEHGRGTPEHHNLDGAENIFQSETMSKALGAYGGFIAADRELIEKIRKTATAYIGSTSLPSPIVAAGCSALKLLKQHPEIRSNLMTNASHLREKIIEMGISTTTDPTPIIPLFFNSRESAEGLSNFLAENHVIAPYINYPVKMDKFIVRITVSAIHAEDQIEQLVALVKKWQDKYGTD